MYNVQYILRRCRLRAGRFCPRSVGRLSRVCTVAGERHVHSYSSVHNTAYCILHRHAYSELVQVCLVPKAGPAVYSTCTGILYSSSSWSSVYHTVHRRWDVLEYLVPGTSTSTPSTCTPSTTNTKHHGIRSQEGRAWVVSGAAPSGEQKFAIAFVRTLNCMPTLYHHGTD